MLSASLLKEGSNNFWSASTTGRRDGIQKYIYEIIRARGESMTSWINRSDEALLDMRRKLAATSWDGDTDESTMMPPKIQGWLLLHRARLRDQDIVGVMTMTGGSLSVKRVGKAHLDLFSDDVLQ